MTPTIKYGSLQSLINFGTIKVPCFILDDGTQILDKTGVVKAMGYRGPATDWLHDFLLHINHSRKLPPELLPATQGGISYFPQDGATTPQIAITPHILFEACKYIIIAKKEGVLFDTEYTFAAAAKEILDGSSDIEKKINYAAGFERFKINRKEALGRFIQKSTNDNTSQWIKTFSDDFFTYWFGFLGFDWEDLVKNPHFAASHIYDMIFTRVDNDLLEELRSSRPRMKYRKENLSEQYVEHPKLKEHLLSLAALMKASAGNQRIFGQLLDKAFPKITQFDIDWNVASSTQNKVDQSMASLNESLLKAITPKPK